MSLRGKKIAIFIEKLYEDLEFWYPYLRLQEEGAEVVIIGPKVESYKGKNGLTVTADQSIIGTDHREFNALIIPGGYSPDHMRRVPEMVKFVKDMHEAGKLIASICHGPWMLASAGILKGKRITSYYSIKDDMINAGAEWVDCDVMSDSKIITSRMPKDLPAFCRKIIQELTSQETA